MELTKEEMQEKINFATEIMKIIQTFDYKRAHVEARVFLGEIDKKYSEILNSESQPSSSLSK